MIKAVDITTFFGEKLIHAGVNLELKPGRIHVLMGPSGGGKSSLLKIISRSTSLPQPGVTSGEVLVNGSTVYSDDLFFVVAQKINMYTKSSLDLLIESIPQGDLYTRSEKEQFARSFINNNGVPLTDDQLSLGYTQLPYAKKTVLLCAIALLGIHRFVCLDEPTAKVNDQEAVEILEMIKKIKQCGKTVLMVLHNQKHAKYIGDEIHLLAGGRIIESSDADIFFAKPATNIAQDFLATGSCSVPSPDSPLSDLSEVGRRYRQIFNTSKPHPTGFHWLIPDILAGCMRPGLLCGEEDDLAKLRKLGIRHLINLEEQQYVPLETLEKFGIACAHFPIVDMKAPLEVDDLQQLLHQIHGLIKANSPVAIHCKAGLGRTGTVLACYMSLTDGTITNPIELIRRINPRWVQSDEQENFVRTFVARQTFLTTTHNQEIVHVTR